MEDIFNNVAGGRGTCSKCGKQVNNVAYHEHTCGTAYEGMKIDLSDFKATEGVTGFLDSRAKYREASKDVNEGNYCSKGNGHRRTVPPRS